MKNGQRFSKIAAWSILWSLATTVHALDFNLECKDGVIEVERLENPNVSGAPSASSLVTTPRRQRLCRQP